MAYICIFLFVLAGLSEGVMDKLQFHYQSSKLSRLKNVLFWNPQLSWLNKYKNGDSKLGEKFIGSTTIFVGFTDAWHFFKLLRNLFIFIGLFFIAIASCDFLSALIYTIISRVVFGLSFSLIFKFLNK